MAEAQGASSRKPRVLLAARPSATAPFRAAIGASAEIIEANTLSSAVAVLKAKSPVSLVCCTLYFDDSRMFDLLAWVRAERPELPFVCGRALAKDLTRTAVETARIAAETRGATKFVDYPEMVESLGEAKARKHLRRILLGELLID
jgi:hypothetical protein